RLKRKLKAVVACGNGTAGAFAPQVMEKIGCEVIPLDTELDRTFPKYNPNPEDMEMLHAIRDAVLANKADVGLGFDGDGDGCGLVSAIAVCDMLDRAPGKSMADLKNALPKTWSSPTMSPHCADELKYNVVDAVVKHFEATQKQGAKIGGQAIRDLVTVNGVR